MTEIYIDTTPGRLSDVYYDIYATNYYTLSRWHLMTTFTSLLDRLFEDDIVDTADVARVSGTNPRSVSRWRTESVVPRRESEERLLELRAVVDLARRVMRPDAARLWMRSPNPDLGYDKPLDLIATGNYQRVVDLLLAIAEGVTS
jgi:putative toxin-antitoxin system antitoxin component (TIGR02293 family)